MKNLNRAAIMQNAWRTYRIRKTSAFSVCLKAAWREYKLANMRVKYEVVSDERVISYYSDFGMANRECETRNKVFFDQRSTVREVFAAA